MKNCRLAKLFADSATGTLYDQLKYKIEQEGGHFVKVTKYYASKKIYSYCGHKA